jgi:hypothetical protein
MADAKPRITKGPETVTPDEMVRLTGRNLPPDRKVYATVRPMDCPVPIATCTNAIGKGGNNRAWKVSDQGKSRVRFRWPRSYLAYYPGTFTESSFWHDGEQAKVRVCSFPGKPKCDKVFVRVEKPPPPAGLIGHTFVSTAVTENGERRPLVPGTRITVSFLERDGRTGVVWCAGCNTFGADVEITADRLLVGVIAGTAAGCRDDLHAQDDWLAGFFGSDPRWRLGDRLVLTSGGTGIELEAGPG